MAGRAADWDQLLLQSQDLVRSVRAAGALQTRAMAQRKLLGLPGAPLAPRQCRAPPRDSLPPPPPPDGWAGGCSRRL